MRLLLSSCSFVLLMMTSFQLLSSDSRPFSQVCPLLYLLNVQPYPTDLTDNDASLSIWDRAFELIPAGHLAEEQINNRSDILPGHELKLIDVDSEACGINIISKGIANVVRELVGNNSVCIVGVVGLFCSPVTNVISPVVSHPKIGGYVQIAASTTPGHPSNQDGSELFHIVESANVFNEATLALMEAYDWKRLSIVHDSLGLFSETVANDLVEKVHSTPQVNLTSHVSLTNSLQDVKETFETLSSEGARISYWSVTYRQSAHLLCEAFNRNLWWPGYVYIIREPTLENILNVNTSCSKEQIMIALEGAFLLQYRLSVNNDTALESGWNYSEYRRMYSNKLRKLASRRQEELNENDYANSFYDQVWSFAFAINNSLPLLSGSNMSRNRTFVSDIIKRELRKISFQGAAGKVRFGDSQQSLTSVNIFQVQGGNPVLVASYNPFTGSLTFTLKAPQYNGIDVPADRFETVYQTIPSWLGGCIIAAQCIVFALVTTNLVLIVKWRKEREIKATSPLFNVLILLGCYIICILPLMVLVHRTFFSESKGFGTAVCFFTNWSQLGLVLITAVLFVTLLRISQIFHVFHRTGKFLTDKYLLLGTLVICAGEALILLLWSAIFPSQRVTRLKFIRTSATGPHYRASTACNISRVFLSLSLIYSGFLLLMVVILAVKTRHIHRHDYKDTKKVNIFIFCVVLIVTIATPLWYIFVEVGLDVGAVVLEWFIHFSIPMLCLLCIFIPKLLPVAIRKVRRHT